MAKINKNYFIALICLVFGLALLTPVFTAKAAAVFNNDAADRPTLRVTNASRNPGCTTCWASTVSASPGEIIAFDIYYHNTSGETASQTKIRTSLPSGSFTSSNITAELWAQNASQVNGSVTVNLTSSQTLTYVSDSVKWYPNRSSSVSSLPYGQNGSEIVGSSGLNIGDIGSGWGTQGHVVFRAQVGSTGGSSGSTPTVVTNAASVSQTSATLNGSVNPNGSNTNAWFEWGTSSALSSTVNYQSIGNGSSNVSISGNLSNLQPNTTYYFRAAAFNSYGTSYGSTLSFNTGTGYGNTPTVTTLSVTSVANNSAVFNGSVNPNNSNTTAWFEYGTSPNLGYTTGFQSISAGNWTLNVTAPVSNLSSSVTYYYRLVANNAYGTSYGTTLSFTTFGVSTSGNTPIASTLPASYVYQNSALLNGSVNPNNSLTNGWFEWGTTTALGRTANSQSMGSGGSSNPLSFALTGLSSNTVYYFRTVAQNSYGASYGSILSFTTSGAQTVIYQPPVIYQPAARYEASLTSTIDRTVASALDKIEVAPGDEITFTPVYRNDNSVKLTNAVLKVILPSETEYVIAAPTPSSQDKNILIFRIGDIYAKTQGVVTIKARVAKDAEENSVLVFSAVLSYNDANNESRTIDSSATAVVKKEAGLLASLIDIIGGVWLYVVFILLGGAVTAWYLGRKSKAAEEEVLTSGA